MDKVYGCFLTIPSITNYCIPVGVILPSIYFRVLMIRVRDSIAAIMPHVGPLGACVFSSRTLFRSLGLVDLGVHEARKVMFCGNNSKELLQNGHERVSLILARQGYRSFTTMKGNAAGCQSDESPAMVEIKVVSQIPTGKAPHEITSGSFP